MYYKICTSMKKIIISASRRTDIPAYYSNWLIKRIKSGYLYYPNPFSQKPVFVDLRPEAVKAFIFWTRNPNPLFKYLDYIDDKYNKHHYMHITINGYPKIFEIRNPSISYVVKAAEFLAKRYGENYVQWRFDPIIFSQLTDKNFIVNAFKNISSKLKGITKRCYISFVDLYEKTRRNLFKLEKTYGIKFYEPNESEKINLVKELLDIAKENQIKLYACTEDNLVKKIPELEKGRCVDYDLIKKICNEDEEYIYKISPSRKECGCYESKDIGYYDSCPHGCVYCYANASPEKSLTNAKKFKIEGFTFDNR